MTRGNQSVEVVGPDERGPSCPCGSPTVRRHFVYPKDGTLLFGRVDFCRACQAEAKAA